MTSFQHNHPFYAPLKKKILLSRAGSSKKVCQLIFDIKESRLSYSPGDSAAILPRNDPKLVAKTISAFHASPSEEISHPRTNQSMTLESFLTSFASITRFSSSLLTLLLPYQKDLQKKEKLKELLQPQNRALLTEYLSSHEVWDFFEEFDVNEIPLKEICSRLMPLLPRFYSITSSLKMHPHEIHLIVGLVSYTTSTHRRLGVSSHYLYDLLQEGERTPLYIQPSHGFSLPEDPSSDIIMIGSGTGVAPFSAFLEERFSKKASGKNWLFFGERNRKSDFYFEDFFTRLEKSNFLKLSCAFSRDQEKKIYVQHRMEEEEEEFFQWLKRGAYLYLCGDAKMLVKDVETTLHKILRNQGSMSQEEAMLYLKNMRLEKRFRKDVY
jgi:sulfite reductase (NADPH) flavoprotein alpha-component